MRIRTVVATVALSIAGATIAAAGPWELVLDAGLAAHPSLDIVPQGYEDEVDPGAVVGLTGIHAVGRERAFEISCQRSWSQIDAVSPAVETIDIVTDAFDFGGTYRPHREGVKPFVSASVGVARIAPDGDFDDEIVWGVALAGGGVFELSPRFGLRLLGRGRYHLGDARTTGTCAGGACSFQLFSGGEFNLEGTLGLVVRLGAHR